MSKAKPFKLYEFAVFFHLPRRKLLFKRLLARLYSFVFSNHHKKGVVPSAESEQCLDYRVGYLSLGLSPTMKNSILFCADTSH